MGRMKEMDCLAAVAMSLEAEVEALRDMMAITEEEIVILNQDLIRIIRF